MVQLINDAPATAGALCFKEIDMAIKKGIYFPDDQAEFLGDVTSKRVAMAVDRYREILRRERVHQEFSEPEWNLLRDIGNGTAFEPAQLIAGSLAQMAEDSQPDGVFEKWDVAPGDLITRLRCLSYPQEVAAVEAIEAWWRDQ